jgi:hypothetical protein
MQQAALIALSIVAAFAIIGAGLTAFCTCLRPRRAKGLSLEEADMEAAVDVQDPLAPIHEPEQQEG